VRHFRHALEKEIGDVLFLIPNFIEFFGAGHDGVGLAGLHDESTRI
jgi:hypothetical protein